MKPDCVAKLLAVIASSLQSQTNTASKSHLLNTVRTSALMTQHLAAFFTGMPAERSMLRQRAFKRAIKVSKTPNNNKSNKDQSNLAKGNVAWRLSISSLMSCHLMSCQTDSLGLIEPKIAPFVPPTPKTLP